MVAPKNDYIVFLNYAEGRGPGANARLGYIFNEDPVPDKKELLPFFDDDMSVLAREMITRAKNGHLPHTFIGCPRASVVLFDSLKDELAAHGITRENMRVVALPTLDPDMYPTREEQYINEADEVVMANNDPAILKIMEKALNEIRGRSVCNTESPSAAEIKDAKKVLTTGGAIAVGDHGTEKGDKDLIER